MEINPNPISVACNLGGDPLPWKNQVKSEKKGGRKVNWKSKGKETWGYGQA